MQLRPKPFTWLRRVALLEMAVAHVAFLCTPEATRKQWPHGNSCMFLIQPRRISLYMSKKKSKTNKHLRKFNTSLSSAQVPAVSTHLLPSGSCLHVCVSQCAPPCKCCLKVFCSSAILEVSTSRNRLSPARLDYITNIFITHDTAHFPAAI